MKNKKKKKNTAKRFIVLLVLLLLLACLLALKFFTNMNTADNAPSAPVPDATMPIETDTNTATAEETTESAPALLPTAEPIPYAPTQAPVILENQGEIEIIIPEEMEQGGF